ncbi:MAG: Trm112 family protein [Gemmatimonadota bacterium]
MGGYHGGAMDVSLSDLLTCPRCGPTYPLILLPYDAADRRVRSGVLGCANCRGRYPIEDGVADVRVAEPGPGGVAGIVEATGTVREGEEGAIRLAGLMGLAEARGTVLVAGPAAALSAALSSLVEGVEVVAVPDVSVGSGANGGLPGSGGDGVGGVEGRLPVGALAGPGVSPVLVTRVLPFRSGSLRGVALTGGRAALVEEGARVLGRAGHLVLDPAPGHAGARLEAVGLEVVAAEATVVVAVRRA